MLVVKEGDGIKRWNEVEKEVQEQIVLTDREMGKKEPDEGGHQDTADSHQELSR